MMDQLMRALAPKDWIGFLTRLAFLIVVVAAANITFAHFIDGFDRQKMWPLSFHFLHATFVGGPFIAFFLAVLVYQIRLQRRLWRLSRKDGLTGLNNRRTFFDMMVKAQTGGGNGILLMLDADWFKRINDSYGHQAGDRCLQSIAHTLRRTIREGDILGRLGGEEFAIFLSNATIGHAQVIGERLTKPISFDTETRQGLSVRLSIGAVQCSPDETLDDVFARADLALYHAKQNGRAQLVFWNPTLDQLAGTLILAKAQMAT